MPASVNAASLGLGFPLALTLLSSASAESEMGEAQRTEMKTVAASLKMREYSLGSVVPSNSVLKAPQKKASGDGTSVPEN